MPMQCSTGRLTACLAAVAVATTGHAQLRVVNWNTARSQGDPIAIQSVFAALAADDVVGFATAPHLVVLQEVRASDIDALEAMLDAAIPGIDYTRATYTTTPSEDGAGGAIALFYRSDTVLEVPAGHVDLSTGAGRKTDRWQLTLAGYSSAAATFYLYGSHLKASQGRENEAQRLAGAQVIRADAATLPAGTHIIYCGDFNLYSNGEPAYAAFLAAGIGQAFDPLGSGSWGGASNAWKHTQSPLDISANGLVGGGMDDRFDFQLSTGAFQDGAGLSLIANTYRALGNDGAHYNLGINVGDNSYYPDDIARSNALADELYVAADHLPVVADYQMPAVMSATLAPWFGRVIQNAVFQVHVSVQNVAAGVPIGVDILDYAIAASGALSGSPVGSAPLVPDVALAPLTVTTSSVGLVSGSAVVTALSEGAQNALVILPTSGQVLRKSNGSFSGAADLNTTTVSTTAASGSGLLPIPVDIHNFGFDANQALLDIDAVAGLGGGFTLVGGLQSGIGATPGTLTFGFDASTFGQGTYTKSIQIQVSDENVPGASAALLALTLQVTLTAPTDPADLNGDGAVDGADLAILLGSWGGDGSGDIDGDGTVGGADLAILLGSWT